MTWLIALAAQFAFAAPVSYQAEQASEGLQSSQAGFIVGAGPAVSPSRAAPSPRQESAAEGPAAAPASAAPSGAGVGVPQAPARRAAAPSGPPLIRWDPGDASGPAGEACLVKPPGLSKIGLVIHNRPAPGKLILDSTPIVCDRAFCAEIGFSGRGCCPLGGEGSPERLACELSMLGLDPTDLVPGPHWMLHGEGSITRHPQNPFLAIVRLPEGGAGGWASVCGNIKPVVCTTIRVP